MRHDVPFFLCEMSVSCQGNKKLVLFLTVHIASLFGDLLDGVVYWCNWWRWWGSFGRSHGVWWYVGFVHGLSCWHERLVSWHGWLGWRRGHLPGRQRGFGYSCGRSFGDSNDRFLWRHCWVACGEPLVIQIWDVVVMIGWLFARSWRVNNHLWNG